MFSLLIILLSSLIFAQSEFEPLFIDAIDPISHSTRSSSWPTNQNEIPDTFVQPQIDQQLNSIAGVQARLYQGSPTISIRGSAHSGRVLSLYNDTPLNFATGFGPPTVLLPKEMIGEVQIIKGPASLFYGSQAMAGSVNFLSRKIEEPFIRLTISDTDSSYLPWTAGGLTHHNVSLGAPIYQNDKSHVQASLFTENDDGDFSYSGKTSSGSRKNNDQNTNRLTLWGQHHFENWDLDYDLVMGNQIRQTPGSLAFPLVTDEKTTAQLLSISPKINFTDSFNLKLKPSYLKTESHFLDATFGASFTKQETFVTQSTWVFLFSESKIQVFADYFSHKLDTSFNSQPLDDDSFEIGIHSEWHFATHWYFQEGFRHLIKDKMMIPHFGIFYENNNLKTWLSYSKGFRKPTLSDRFANFSNFVANPNLKPEGSQQYEWGLRLGSMDFKEATTFANRWQMEARLFYINYSNFIERTSLSGTTFTKSNLGEGKSYGGELSQNYGYGPWEFFLNYSYLEARSKQSNEPFLLAPKHQLTWGAYHFIGPLKIELENSLWKHYYDRDLTSQLVKLEDWSQWNLIFHSYGFSKVNFSIGVLNLFNSSRELTLNYPEPQRRYWAQITWKF